MTKKEENIKLNTTSLQQHEPKYELVKDAGIVSNAIEQKSQISAESGGVWQEPPLDFMMQAV